MTLEEQLREASKKGLASLTLYAEWSSDRTKTYWTCRATPSARHGYVGVEHSLDPVEAMQECLKALPGAKMRAEKTHREAAAPEARDAPLVGSAPVTATVTEPSDLAGGPDPVDMHTSGFERWMK